MNTKNLNINFENILFDMLSWESGLYINKKLIGFFGLELSAITSYLISQAKFHKENYSMTKDGFFYATDLDIILYVGIKTTRITDLKREGLEHNLFTIGVPSGKRGITTLRIFLTIDAPFIFNVFRPFFIQKFSQVI
ncbi:hypothetical protein [Fusobacterium varium]